MKFPLTQKNQKLNLAFKKRILGLDKDLAYEFISNAKGELALQSALVKARNIDNPYKLVCHAETELCPIKFNKI